MGTGMRGNLLTLELQLNEFDIREDEPYSKMGNALANLFNAHLNQNYICAIVKNCVIVYCLGNDSSESPCFITELDKDGKKILEKRKKGINLSTLPFVEIGFPFHIWNEDIQEIYE